MVKTNFWTVLKNIDDIYVSEEIKEKINSLRKKHEDLLEDVRKYEPKIENNVVVVTQEQVDKCYEIWGKAENIRDEIESLIRMNSK